MSNSSNKPPAKLKIYKGKYLNVSFDANRCSHGGNCIKSLPSVFNLKTRPWIKLEDCAIDKLISTINNCPSGALNYSESVDQTVSAQLIRNGPVNLRGNINLKKSFQEVGLSNQRLSLCRCGLSKNKPFCDTSHLKKFQDKALIDHRPASKTQQKAAEHIDLICIENGPLMCKGNVKFIASDGEELTVIDPAICRCGASNRKPFCDVTHNKIKFKTE